MPNVSGSQIIIYDKSGETNATIEKYLFIFLF